MSGRPLAIDDDDEFLTEPLPRADSPFASLDEPPRPAGFGTPTFDELGFEAEDDFAFPAGSGMAEPALDDDFAPMGQGHAAPAPLPTEGSLGETVAPRITIHVFCENPETDEAMSRAADDRRLARATTVIRPGGLQGALAFYENQPTPSLVIVESSEGAGPLLAGLDKLAEVCDSGTKVVVVGPYNDIGLYRELIRRGVSEYLTPPLQPLQIIRTITSLYSDPATPFVGRSLAFVGAKGGVGASSLAHNVAYILAEHLLSNTIVADFDLPFGTAGLDFNQDPLQGVADALSKPDRLDPVLLDRMTARCTDRLSLFAAPADLAQDHEFSAEAYEEVTSKIRSIAPFVVFDLPHVWGAWMRKTLLSADDVVIVAAPELASLRNAKNIIDLIGKGRPNDAPPKLIINQVNLPGRPEIPVKDFAKALGVEPALCLPFDAKLFGQAANNGQMLHEVNPKAKASEGLLQFVQQLVRREAQVQRPRSLIERLLKKA
jgi:pilus assembly protein CpaE